MSNPIFISNKDALTDAVATAKNKFKKKGEIMGKDKTKYDADWSISDFTLRELYSVKDILDECANAPEMIFEWQKAVQYEIERRERI